MNIMYPAIFHPLKDGSFEVSFPDFEGCVTTGNTLEEAFFHAREALTLYLDGVTEFPKTKASFQGLPKEDLLLIVETLDSKDMIRFNKK